MPVRRTETRPLSIFRLRPPDLEGSLPSSGVASGQTQAWTRKIEPRKLRGAAERKTPPARAGPTDPPWALIVPDGIRGTPNPTAGEIAERISGPFEWIGPA